MRAAMYLSPSARAFSGFHSGNWAAPIQAAFAFFAPRQIQVHAVPNERIDKADTLDQCAASKVSCFATHTQFADAAVACSGRLAQPAVSAATSSQASSLKILREFEPGKSRSSTGRLVISGRMADVCAALDRMASHSTVGH
jgi:hypothetical protein